jgi:hypothetical protein
MRRRPWLRSLLPSCLLACTAADDGLAPPATVAGGDGGASTTDAAPAPTTTSPDPPAPATTDDTPATPDDTPSTDGPGLDAGGDASGDPPPTCGDGVVDPGEMCDLGHGHNSNFGSCTLSCRENYCGDGFVHVGVESCDAGPDYNDAEYNGCTMACTLGPHCGDGTLQGPEQCDHGEANGGGDNPPPDSLPCTDTCHLDGRLVFLTDATFTPAELGGPAGADQICQTAAADAGLDAPDKFRAWLSHAYQGPAELGVLAPDEPYALLSGLRVADHANQLLTTGPLRGITMTETGQTIHNTGVWTGVAPDGAAYNDDLDCDDWDSNAPLLKGRVGNSGPDKDEDPDAWQTWKAEGHWTSETTKICSYSYRLYCFES